MIKLKKLIMTSLDDPPKMRAIIDRQRECREQTHCYSCGNESDCLVINGIAHLNLDEIKTAIEYLEEANRQFRNQGDIWNQTVSLALIGEAYEKNKKNYRALLEFEKAYNTSQIISTDSFNRISKKRHTIGRDAEGSDRHASRKEPAITGKCKSPIMPPWIPEYT